MAKTKSVGRAKRSVSQTNEGAVRRASRNVRPGAEIKLGAVGILDRFDFAISGFAEDGVDRTEIAAVARRRCGDAPLTVVGDTVADILGARHIGARSLAVAWGFEEKERLEAAGPDRLVNALGPELLAWLLG